MKIQILMPKRVIKAEQEQVVAKLENYRFVGKIQKKKSMTLFFLLIYVFKEDLFCRHLICQHTSPFKYFFGTSLDGKVNNGYALK